MGFQFPFFDLNSTIAIISAARNDFFSQKWISVEVKSNDFPALQTKDCRKVPKKPDKVPRCISDIQTH